jgi:hypothetical protein
VLSRNIEQLITVARQLGPLLPELVFVGGAVTGLLVTDEGAGAPRVTRDVDAIAEISSYAGYASFSERLRALGFIEDTSAGAPVCRWNRGETILDLVPSDGAVLGFSNRWYRRAIETAETREIAKDVTIRVVTAPCFLATKMEAFHGRGNGDFSASHDLEDVVYVIDGRSSIVAEVGTESEQLREYLRFQVRELLQTQGFVDALPGYLMPDAASQARLNLVLSRLQDLAR